MKHLVVRGVGGISDEHCEKIARGVGSIDCRHCRVLLIQILQEKIPGIRWNAAVESEAKSAS